METLPLIHIMLSADDTPCEGTTYLPLYEMPPEQGYTFDKGAEIKLKKKWWETGERTAIKSDGTYEIWHSRQEEELEVIDFQISVAQWMPHKQHPHSNGVLEHLVSLGQRARMTDRLETLLSSKGAATARHPWNHTALDAAACLGRGFFCRRALSWGFYIHQIA
jgi:hypothetical protein